jgi:hypothetical protein
MTVRLVDVASVIRSKNAGPYQITLDIIFKERRIYERVRRSGVVNAEAISALYQITRADVLGIVGFEPACAIKITFRRPIVSGDVGDSDIYGAQHHAPLLDLVVDGLD